MCAALQALPIQQARGGSIHRGEQTFVELLAVRILNHNLEDILEDHRHCGTSIGVLLTVRRKQLPLCRTPSRRKLMLRTRPDQDLPGESALRKGAKSLPAARR